MALRWISLLPAPMIISVVFYESRGLVSDESFGLKGCNLGVRVLEFTQD
jgi:hypothetical protein